MRHLSTPVLLWHVLLAAWALWPLGVHQLRWQLGNVCKENVTSRLRGPFYDQNCALAFLVENKHLMPETNYLFAVDYIIKQRANSTPNFCRAPPSAWLKTGKYDQARWLAAYKGPRVVGQIDLKAEHEKAIAVAVARERQVKQNERRAASGGVGKVAAKKKASSGQVKTDVVKVAE